MSYCFVSSNVKYGLKGIGLGVWHFELHRALDWVGGSDNEIFCRFNRIWLSACDVCCSDFKEYTALDGSLLNNQPRWSQPMTKKNVISLSVRVTAIKCLAILIAAQYVFYFS